MNLAELEKSLWAGARSHRVSDHVPYAFEQRVIAHIRALPVLDPISAFAAALWRGAISCMALSVVVCSLTMFLASSGASGETTVDLEGTVLAAVDELPESP